MSIVVRPIQPLEYAAATAIHNADNEPHFQTSTERLQTAEESRTNGSRLVAVQGSEVIGTAEFWSWPAVEAYRIGIHALEADSQLEAQGLMLKTIESEARTRGVKRLLATVRADFLVNAPFLQFGFNEVFRSFGANLELKDFEPERLADLEGALNARGITIKSYAELGTRGGRAQSREARGDSG